MHTYFARHTNHLLIDDTSRKRLWEECRIAVHYPENASGNLAKTDNASSRPEDYPPKSKARSVIGALKTLADEGGYVCAEHFGENQVQIGWVPPGSAIELIDGRWAPPEDRTAVLKTIRLQKVRVLTPLESAVVLAGRPRMGTL
jgi:hypothetical protein